MKWFRLYGEARNDAKLRVLSDAHHRVWFNLLCYASEMETRGCINSVDRELLSVECASGDVDLLNETLAKLVKLRIVTAEDENVCFVNFMKRQYDKPSDSPARVSERVSRHRAKVETLLTESVTPSNAIVTREKRAYSDSDTDTDSDTHTEQKKAESVCERVTPAGFTTFWTAYPNKQGKEEAWRAWQRLKPDAALLETMLSAITQAKAADQWQRGIVPHPSNWLNQKRWTDELPPPGSALDRASSAPPRPSTVQGTVDDTARALRAAELQVSDMRQSAQLKGLLL